MTANERVKAVSTWFFNLSAALTGATAARIWIVGQFDLSSLGWSIVAVALFAVAFGTLYLLQPEDEP
ncbi:MAG TPA: hypothetical protein VGW40_12175 [Allosphingosinicella sp.]|nr:hypothetical protein [Allosphingosinicella sp.]